MADQQEEAGVFAPKDGSPAITLVPVVSIVVPLYNRADRIAQVMRTVLEQTFVNWELILVDDASTVDVLSIINPFLSDLRILYLRLEKNAGPGSARNRGVELARGSYVAFLDSDDSWEPEKLERQVSAMSEQLDERAFCVTLTTINMGDRWSRIRPNFDPKTNQSFAEYLYCDGGFVQASSLLLPRTLALRLKFVEGLRKYEDHLYCIQLHASGARYVVVQLPLTVWNNDGRTDRLSGVETLDHCEAFLKSAASFLTPQADAAFRVRVMSSILLKSRPLLVVKLVMRSCRLRAIAPKQLAAIIARISLPSPVWALIRRSIG